MWNTGRRRRRTSLSSAQNLSGTTWRELGSSVENKKPSAATSTARGEFDNVKSPRKHRSSFCCVFVGNNDTNTSSHGKIFTILPSFSPDFCCLYLFSSNERALKCIHRTGHASEILTVGLRMFWKNGYFEKLTWEGNGQISWHKDCRQHIFGFSSGSVSNPAKDSGDQLIFSAFVWFLLSKFVTWVGNTTSGLCLSMVETRVVKDMSHLQLVRFSTGKGGQTSKELQSEWCPSHGTVVFW